MVEIYDRRVRGTTYRAFKGRFVLNPLLVVPLAVSSGAGLVLFPVFSIPAFTVFLIVGLATFSTFAGHWLGVRVVSKLARS